MNDLLLIARIGDQAVAFEATMIEAVVNLDAVESVPFATAPVVGLAAIRSQIVTVVDCALAVGADALPPHGRAVVVLVDGHRYALRLSAIEDVVAVPATQREGIGVEGNWAARATARVDLGDRFAILLDLSALIAPIEFERAA